MQEDYYLLDQYSSSGSSPFETVKCLKCELYDPHIEYFTLMLSLSLIVPSTLTE